MKPPRAATPELANQWFKADVVTMTDGTVHTDCRARFDALGFLLVDTPAGSFEVGGPGSLVKRLDPIRWME